MDDLLEYALLTALIVLVAIAGCTNLWRYLFG